jgi:predicted nucleic acid-binding protein
LLLESDVFIAYIKKEDWLKKAATAIIDAVEKGQLGLVQASTEIFHELYYVFSDYASLDTIVVNEARIATIKNLTYVAPDYATYLAALSLMDTYRMTSIFDAIYAATALSNNVQDHTIISTDKKYDCIKGLKRIDPQKLKI